MSNPFYNPSGVPQTASQGASSVVRSEFAAVAAGFDKLPATLTANKAVVVNAGGTAMTLTTGSLALNADLTVNADGGIFLPGRFSTGSITPDANTWVSGFAAVFNVVNNATAYNLAALKTYGDGTIPSGFDFTRCGGTELAPTKTLSAMAVVSIGGRGHNNVAMTGSMAALIATADADWASGSCPTTWSLEATPSGSETRTGKFQLNGLGYATVSSRLGIGFNVKFALPLAALNVVGTTTDFHGHISVRDTANTAGASTDAFISFYGSNDGGAGSATGRAGIIGFSGGDMYILNALNTKTIFRTNNANVGAWDASGNFLAGTTITTGNHQIDKNTTGTTLLVRNTSAAPSGGGPLGLQFSGSAPNNTTALFLVCADNAADRLYIYSNGNVVNTNNSYGALSDITLKTDIRHAKSQWDDVKALGSIVSNYRLKSDKTGAVQLGLIAQEVKEISPGLIFEGKSGLLGVQYSILHLKALKALSEAMERIEILEGKLK